MPQKYNEDEIRQVLENFIQSITVTIEHLKYILGDEHDPYHGGYHPLDLNEYGACKECNWIDKTQAKKYPDCPHTPTDHARMMLQDLRKMKKSLIDVRERNITLITQMVNQIIMQMNNLQAFGFTKN